LLVRLDATQARSSLQVVSKQLDDFRVRMARLIAERDGLDQPEMSPEIAARAAEPGIKALMASEQSLFNARVKARQNQKELLQSRVAQLGEQISGLDSQIKSKADQLQLIAGELTGVQDLYDKRLVPLTRLTTLQRESARIDGERGQLLSSIAETKAKVGEAQLSMVKIDQDFRTDVVKELNDVQGKANELVERGVAAKDTLDRIELRAPTSGIVNQLNVHTIGGVIRPGDTIMEVVPDSDDLQIEARVQPKDIDEVRVGQKAFVAFSALNSRVAPGQGPAGRWAGFHSQGDDPGGGAPPPGGCKAGLGHARRTVHANRQPHHAELPVQADHRTAGPCIRRAVAHVPAKWNPVRRPGHAQTIESTALSVHMGSPSDPL
jgi:HlyD family secretion protein